MQKYLIEKLKEFRQLFVIRSAFDGFILTGFIAFLSNTTTMITFKIYPLLLPKPVVGLRSNWGFFYYEKS